MRHDVVIRVNGERFDGFDRGEINLSIDAAAPSFRLHYGERWTPHGQDWPVDRGDEIEILFDSTLIVTGYVDHIQASHDARNQTFFVEGRSRTQDIVDCSAIYKKGQWKHQKIGKIARDLCTNFDIEVQVDGDEGKPFRRFALSPGETVYQAISRAANLRGLFLSATPSGNLLLHGVGTEKTATQLVSRLNGDGNIISASRVDEFRNRYNVYLVRGQTFGDDETNKKGSSDLFDLVVDRAVQRYRPFAVVARGHAGKADLKRRAVWERNRRGGRSERLSVVVDGWTNAEGFWRPNVLAHIVDEWLHVDAEMLVSLCSFSFGVRSAIEAFVTRLELMRKEAFSQEPYPVRRRRRKLAPPLPAGLPQPVFGFSGTQGLGLPGNSLDNIKEDDLVRFLGLDE